MADAHSTPATTEDRPLSGLRVLDFSIMMAGPYTGRYLADLGAEVIKIEAPDGDYVRKRAPVRSSGSSTYFAQMNAGKRSVTVDLKSPEGLSQVRALLNDADVVLENFRPGVMKRLALDYQTVRLINPRIVYCSISGYGQTGPSAKKSAYAQIVQAAAGYDMVLQDHQGIDRPPSTAIYPADMMAAIYASFAIMSAIHQRGRTGEGQHIDVSLIEGLMHLMVGEFQEAQLEKIVTKRPVHRPLECADGFVLVAPTTPKNFEGMCDSMNRPELRQDPRFETDKLRVQHWQELLSEIENWTRNRPGAECEAAFEATGVPCARYRTVKEAMQDPQFAHRGSFQNIQDGDGVFKIPNLPFKMTGGRTDVIATVPVLGEYNDTYLGEHATQD